MSTTLSIHADEIATGEAVLLNGRWPTIRIETRGPGGRGREYVDMYLTKHPAHVRATKLAMEKIVADLGAILDDLEADEPVVTDENL